jgi:hypothetical protein
MSLFRNKSLISTIKFSILIIGLSSVGFASGSSGYPRDSGEDVYATLVREYTAEIKAGVIEGLTPNDIRRYDRSCRAYEARTWKETYRIMQKWVSDTIGDHKKEEFDARVTPENYPWMTAVDQLDYSKYVPYERNSRDGFLHNLEDQKVTNPYKYIKLKQDWLEKRRIDRQNLIEFDASVNLATYPWMTEEMLQSYRGYEFKRYVGTGYVASLQPITDPKKLLDQKMLLIERMKESRLPPEEDRRDATVGVNHPNARFIS